MIEDKDFDDLLRSEQALSSASPLALMVAGYYQTLRANKVPANAALVLTREFQLALLARQFAVPIPSKDV